jgi:hypothetical protein
MQALKIHASPRCGARTRSAKPCNSPTMPDGRCRLHGGKSLGAPKGNSNAFKHGRYSAEAMAERRHFRELLAEINKVIERFGDMPRSRQRATLEGLKLDINRLIRIDFITPAGIGAAQSTGRIARTVNAGGCDDHGRVSVGST